ncbi:MAG: hypothetical protein ABEJ82_10190 [Haloplanus sp.]
MTDDIDWTRRRTLAALGAIGTASATAGFGTSAYLSDEERFAGSALTAGTLDLKVAWAEHYAGVGSLGERVRRVDGDPSAVPGGYVGLPTPVDPVVAVPQNELSRVLAETAVEAYPDPDDDGVQDAFAAAPGETTADGVGYICADGADTPADLDPTASLRTLNEDTQGEAGAKPLFAFEDLKPGDFGIATLTYHLCGNPGYVWLRGGLVENAENGQTEPESVADESDGGDLLDAVQVAVWYDDGDGVFGTNVTPVTGQTTTSLGELLTALSQGRGLRLCPGGVEGTCVSEKTYDSRHVTGDTVTVADGSHTIAKNPTCEAFGLLEGVKTDEAPEGNLPQTGTTTYETAYGTLTVTTGVVDGDQTVTDWSFESDDYCVAKLVVKGGNEGANVYSYDNPDGDDDFTNDAVPGAMSDADTQLQTPTGQDISHLDACLARTGDCCFEPSTDHTLGFAWWLPRTAGNAVQTDSVAFDVGFYTEQCRHNDPEGRR